LENTYAKESVQQDLALKLDDLAELLRLTPYRNGQLKSKLGTISCKAIEPIHIICPNTMTCTTSTCKPRHLKQVTKTVDIPNVTLLKGTTCIKNAYVLTGKCQQCKTLYVANHKSFFLPNSQQRQEVYLNNTSYLKIGQSLWVNQVFSKAVINATYSFHASASAFTQFWNDSYALEHVQGSKLYRAQTWQAFIQESIRLLAGSSVIDFEMQANSNIDDVVLSAFNHIGETGLIHAAYGHSYSECTSSYCKPQPAEEDNMEVDDESIEETTSPVKMVVLDGIVMGPMHCAFDNCTAPLANTRGESLCGHHQLQFGNRCQMRGCGNARDGDTFACLQHGSIWHKIVQKRNKSSLTGFRRVLQQQPAERQPWQQPEDRELQPHDGQEAEEVEATHFFIPQCFYCVETICAPCGVVIAWTKFDRSESTTKILQFLEQVYPSQPSCPDYICIDKACQLLRTIISSGSWDDWKLTSRFIVDTYHYTNHKATDDLCCTWCNPTPSPEVDPNLVGTRIDDKGIPRLYRKFNTEAAEQLNSWLAGYASILKRMNAANFNWVLHTMLFVHTQHIIKKRTPQNGIAEEDNGVDDDSSSEGSESEKSQEVEMELDEEEEEEEEEEEDTNGQNEQKTSSDDENDGSGNDNSSTESSSSSDSESSDSR